MPELIASFALRHPKVRFELRLTNTAIDLVGEGIDLAIRASPRPLADSSLVARRLGSPALRLYAAPGYVARRGSPKEVGDPKHDWVLFRPMLAFLPKTLPPPRFISDDLLCIRELLRQGAGIGPLSPYLAGPLLRSGELSQVFELPRWRGGGLFLVYPAGATPDRKVIAFRDFLLERANRDPDFLVT